MIPFIGAASSLLGGLGSAASGLSGMFGGSKTKVSSASNTSGGPTYNFGAQNKGLPPWVWAAALGAAILAAVLWFTRPKR